MANSFYIDFDEALLETRPDDQRTRFQRDRDRILHSFAFRRLQSKTQVFWTGEYDFYRTRLTHSIEVSQIGRSICDHLKRQSSLLSETFYIDQDLVEAVCLAHDLGHPPFGHANERLLNHLMRRYGGFEANAQTLRIITEIFYSNKEERSGMAPTRALVDGVMKYKTLHSQLNPAISQFIYDEQQKYLDFVFDNRPIPGNITPGEKLNSFRSIECQIMDWADDIAFSLNDFTDCVHAGLITIDNVKKWVKENSVTSSLNPVIYKLVAAMEKGDVERKLAADIGKFIRGCNLKKTNNFMSDRTNRYSFQLTVKSNIMKEKDLYKHMCDDLVFKSPQIRQLEYKSKYILSQLFKAFNSNYINKLSPGALLLPADTERTICGLPSKRERARVICDYISGMSDSFSIRVYKRLLDPDFGSILDLV